MKRAILFLFTIAIAAMTGAPTLAATGFPDEPVTFEKRGLSGPRFGMTYVTGHGALYADLEREGMGRVLSQFGWHFEHQVIPQGGGPQFVVEFVPMIAGVEYGKFIPSGTLAMGVRLPSGVEFGLGPNLMLTKSELEQTEINTALVMAVGKSFDYGGVSVPINLTYATNPDGNRVSLIIGYAVAKVAGD
ncbi:hypothetical protein KKG45_09140 [bacterium]|nr:hypothetical protein [bacterium]MBU1073398.1 hypothetical protein [bacterium]MBU1676534.1 hypothetical protein [bacterium]